MRVVGIYGAWSLDEFEAEVEQSFLVLRERVSVSVGNQFRLEDGSVICEKTNCPSCMLYSKMRRA